MLPKSYETWVCTCPSIEAALCDPWDDPPNCEGCLYFMDPDDLPENK